MVTLGTRYKWLLFLLWPCTSSDYTSGFIAMSNYWTILEYDECNVVFMEFVDMTLRVHNMWRYKRVVGCIKNQLLGSENFFENLF
jgi:hypothetical protein